VDRVGDLGWGDGRPARSASTSRRVLDRKTPCRLRPKPWLRLIREAVSTSTAGAGNPREPLSGKTSLGRLGILQIPIRVADEEDVPVASALIRPRSSALSAPPGGRLPDSLEKSPVVPVSSEIAFEDILRHAGSDVESKSAANLGRVSRAGGYAFQYLHAAASLSALYVASYVRRTLRTRGQVRVEIETYRRLDGHRSSWIREFRSAASC